MVMVPIFARTDALLESSVMLFQCAGFIALVLSRLAPTARGASRARLVFLVALVGLGITGAACSSFDSEFALFAGGTMTVLLVGMTLPAGGGEPVTATIPSFRVAPRDF